MRELARRKKEERYRYFVPNGKQKEFNDQDSFIRIFSAANGVGKTGNMANVIAHMTCPIYNKWFDTDFFRNSPKSSRGRIVSTGTNIQANIVPELKKWFPKGQWTTSKGGKVFESQWKVNDHSFDIMTYEQDPAEFESVTLDWIWFDEPPPYKIYAASVARFRFGGTIYITMTPLSDSAWIYDELILDEKTKKTVTYAEVEDNCKKHGTRGILEHDNIEQMIAEYTEDEREARTKGRFMHLAGLVYKSYQQRVHWIEPFNLNPGHHTVYCALDPHPRTPHAVMWLAVDRNGTKYIVDELFTTGSPEEMVALIRAKEQEKGWNIRMRIIDPMAYVPDQNKDMPILQEQLAKLGLYFEKASKDLSSGILRVQQALSYGVEDSIIVKAPELYVFNTCTRTDWEFKRYIWDEWSPIMQDRRQPKKKPRDKDDHMMECLYRLMLLEPRYLDPTTESPVMFETNEFTGY